MPLPERRGPMRGPVEMDAIYVVSQILANQKAGKGEQLTKGEINHDNCT